MPAHIGDAGALVKEGVGVASMIMVLIISVVVLQPAPAFCASNFICQQPAILTKEDGITKLLFTSQEGLKELSIAK